MFLYYFSACGNLTIPNSNTSDTTAVAGSMVFVQCSRGFVGPDGHGTATVTCSQYGTWTYSTPLCQGNQKLYIIAQNNTQRMY